MRETQGVGISFPVDVIEQIDERRETDSAHPDHEFRSEYVVRLVRMGLAVEEAVEELGGEPYAMDSRGDAVSLKAIIRQGWR